MTRDPHRITETGIERADARREGFDDRLFEETRDGTPGRRGKEEGGVEGVDEAREGPSGSLFKPEEGKEGNIVGGHRAEEGHHPFGPGGRYPSEVLSGLRSMKCRDSVAGGIVFEEMTGLYVYLSKT